MKTVYLVKGKYNYIVNIDVWDIDSDFLILVNKDKQKVIVNKRFVVNIE